MENSKNKNSRKKPFLFFRSDQFCSAFFVGTCILIFGGVGVMVQWVDKVLPCKKWIQHYQLSLASHDLLAGLTVAFLALPQALAFSSIAGVPPIIGIYSAIICPVIYCIFASSQVLIVGPTSILSLVISTVAASASAEHEGVGPVLLCSLICGLLTFSLGLLGIGKYFPMLVSHTVIDAFTVSGALVIMSTQLAAFFGIPKVKGDSIFEILGGVYEKGPEFHQLTYLTGIVCLVALLLFKFCKKKFKVLQPLSGFVTLAAVGISMLVCWQGEFHRKGVAVVGAMSVRFSAPQIPSLSGASIGKILVSALLCTLIGLMEAISIATVFQNKIRIAKAKTAGYVVVEADAVDNEDDEASSSIASEELLLDEDEAEGVVAVHHFQLHHSEELRALGLANIVGSLFSGYASTGSFSRTAVNYESGATTPLSNAFSGVFVLGLALALGAEFQYLPKSVLSAIVIAAVSGLVDFTEVLSFWKGDKLELFPWLATAVGVLFLGIEKGLGIGIAANVILMAGRYYAKRRSEHKLIEQETSEA